MRQMGSCLFGFCFDRTEEPYEGNLLVRVCEGGGWVTGRSYSEPDALASACNARLDIAPWEAILEF
jgi:hypothetical protein